jgi:hypothetical protein
MHKTACLLLLMASTAVAAPPVPLDVMDALDGYRHAPLGCFPHNEEEQDESKRNFGQLMAEAKRDFVAMKAYYNNDFIYAPPPGTRPTIQAVSPPILCKTLEELKSDEDTRRSALDRLTRTLVAHGVLPQQH